MREIAIFICKIFYLPKLSKGDSITKCIRGSNGDELQLLMPTLGQF